MSHYETSYLTARYENSLDAVVMKWHNFAEGEAFRDGLDAGLDLVQEESAGNWLADLREMGTVTEDDKQWTNDDWFPRAMQTSLSNMAIVQPESVIASMGVDKIMQEVGDGELKTHYFDNRSEATRWLQNDQ